MENKPVKSGFFARYYALLINGASRLQSPVLLILRLYWGWQFFLLGKGKLMDPGKVADFFRALHIPFPLVSACLAGSAECFGGLLLVAGLFSRLAALPLIFTLGVAYVTTESGALKNILHDPHKFLTANPFLFLLVSVIVLVFGPGAFSLDYLWLKTERPKS